MRRIVAFDTVDYYNFTENKFKSTNWPTTIIIKQKIPMDDFHHVLPRRFCRQAIISLYTCIILLPNMKFANHKNHL